MLKEQFNKDLQQGKEGEQIVKQYLQKVGCQVKDVSEQPQYYHIGDFFITSPSGQKRYVEVKNDTVIAKTENILCEEEVYFKENDYAKPGFMYSNYDIYAVVSQEEEKIYFFNFAKLKEIYKRFGTWKKIDHKDQYSNCYLLELCRAKQFGALMAIVNY